MKRLIIATTKPAVTKGTMFYRIPLNQILRYFSKKSENCWMWALFDNMGLDAIDMNNNLFGSFVDGDDLYVCVTDNKPINVKGESVSPEYAAEEYSIKDLQRYITDGTDFIIHRYITPHEVFEPDFDGWYYDLLDVGYSVDKVNKDMINFNE